MNKSEVTLLTNKLISQKKLEYINCGEDLSYQLTTSKTGNIGFTYHNNKLYKLTITFYGTTKEELKRIIHQELCNKQYTFYNDYFLSMYYYIKNNVIITISYEEIKSNISGVPNTKITKMEYLNAKTRKEMEATEPQKEESFIGNPNDF